MRLRFKICGSSQFKKYVKVGFASWWMSFSVVFVVLNFENDASRPGNMLFQMTVRAALLRQDRLF